LSKPSIALAISLLQDDRKKTHKMENCRGHVPGPSRLGRGDWVPAAVVFTYPSPVFTLPREGRA